MHTPMIATLWAALWAPTAEDPFAEIRALDSAAAFELEQIKGRCGDPAAPDQDAAAAAERASNIHRTRIGLARQRAGAASEDLVALAFQAADAHQRAYACDPRSARHLEAAHALLASVRAELTDPRSALAVALDRRVTELETELAAWRARQPPEPETTRASVQIVALEGDVRPGPRDTLLGRLALRLEGGGTFVRAGEPPTYFYHRGGGMRVSALARFAVGSRHYLLFGTYYGFSRVADLRGQGEAWWAGDMSLHRVGAQFEAQWSPSARLGPWLSLHPALEVGLEQQIYALGRGSGRATGFQVGGSLGVCVWHASVCPLARVVASPLTRGQAVTMVQAGVSLDVLRWIDLGITRRSRRRGAARG